MRCPCSNKIISGLGAVEAASVGVTATVPPDLLEHLADTELNNPDIWLQSKLQELLEAERIRQLRSTALQRISHKLLEPKPIPPSSSDVEMQPSSSTSGSTGAQESSKAPLPAAADPSPLTATGAPKLSFAQS